MLQLVFCVFLLFVGNVRLQELECKLSVPITDNKQKIFKDIFQWTTPQDSLGSSGKPVRNGQNVELTCGNGFLKNDFIDTRYTFSCNQGKFNRTFHYEDLLCRSDQFKHVVVSQTPPSMFRSKLFKCSEPEFRLYTVKKQNPDGTLKTLYSSCINQKMMRAKFGHEPRRSEKPLLRHRPDGPVWGFDGFGSDTNERFYLSKGYLKKTQAKRIARAYPDKYGQTKEYPYYFNRGHLVAMADYNNEDEQLATCEYLNAAPQWDAFNSGEWSLVERAAREMLQNDTNNWEIYTGTYGIIPTPRGPLHVAPVFDANGRFQKQLLPVPMLYWKVVHHLKDKTRSRAFVGVNNPEYKSWEEIPASYKICTAIKPPGSNNIYSGNEFQGFSYECKLDDLLQKLKTTEKIVK